MTGPSGNQRTGIKFTWIASQGFFGWFLLGATLACFAVYAFIDLPISATIRRFFTSSTPAAAIRSFFPFVEFYSRDENIRQAMTAAALLLIIHAIGYILLFKPTLRRLRQFVRDSELEALDGSMAFALAVVLICVIILGMTLNDPWNEYYHRLDPEFFGRRSQWIASIRPPTRWTLALGTFVGAAFWIALMFAAMLTAFRGDPPEESKSSDDKKT